MLFWVAKSFFQLIFFYDWILTEDCFVGLSQDDIYHFALKLAKKSGIEISIERKSVQRKESGLKIAESEV